MSDSKENNESDVESNSSWTLLAEDTPGFADRLTEKCDQQQPVSIVEPFRKVESLLQIKEINSSDISSNVKSLESDPDRLGDVETISTTSSISLESLTETATGVTADKQGCLTLEEYLAAEELSHDCDYDSRAETWEYAWDYNKSGKRRQKKRKAENVTTLTVVGAVLSIAGISLMCMMTPFLSRQLLTPDLQNKVENNFTKVESSYATANGLKVYIDKSNRGMKFLNNAEVLEPFLKQCGQIHAHNTESINGKIQKSEKINEPNAVEQPLTYEQFLKEKPGKNASDSDRQTGNKNEADAKPKSEKREKTAKLFKGNEIKELKMQTKSLKTNEKKKFYIDETREKLDSPKGIASKVRDVPAEIPNRKDPKEVTKGTADLKKMDKSQSTKRKEHKDIKLRKTLVKANRHSNAASKKVCKSDGQRSEDTKKSESEALKKTEEKKIASSSISPSKSIEKIGSALQRVYKNHAKVKEPNFVLVTSKPTKSMPSNEGELEQIGKGPIEKIVITPKKKLSNNVGGKKNENTTPSEHLPKLSSPPWYSRISKTDIIACQLLQDICLLKITSKLREETKAKQKKLKRKLERRRLRSSKTSVNEHEEEEKLSKKKQKKINVESEKRTVDYDSQFRTKSQQFSFKPKLVDNRLTTKSGAATLSNFDLLKELPFMVDQRKERKDGTALRRPATVPIGKSLSDRVQYTVNIPHGKVTKRRNNPRRAISFKEIVTNCDKSKRFLENTKKTNEEKIKMLEQMKLENQLKIEELIKERRERMKKDASLGIYSIPLPNYADVSDELKQLKNTKIQHGFLFDSLTSSDSESERFFPRNLESKISSEFMTALKVGKKVSDTFREWTLKKAPTLTSLKNYCNSKVSQISERLSNQCTNQTSIESTVDKEELEALKSRKEKHEQLKKFWKAKQDYLDKRIEICDILKRKLAPENIKQETIAQGVQILDSIISDVLKTVKNSKSCVDRSQHMKQNDTGSKSIVALIANNKNSEGEQTIAQSADRNSYCSRPDDLYSWLFERRAVAIRRKDQFLFSPVNSKPGYAERKREASKQDPSRVYQEKIIKKHN